MFYAYVEVNCNYKFFIAHECSRYKFKKEIMLLLAFTIFHLPQKIYKVFTFHPPPPPGDVKPAEGEEKSMKEYSATRN